MPAKPKINSPRLREPVSYRVVVLCIKTYPVADGRRCTGAKSPGGAGQVIGETGRVGLNLVTGARVPIVRENWCSPNSALKRL